MVALKNVKLFPGHFFLAFFVTVTVGSFRFSGRIFPFISFYSYFCENKLS